MWRRDHWSKFKTTALYFSEHEGSNAIENVLIVSGQGTFRSTMYSCSQGQSRRSTVETLPIIGFVHRIQNRDSSVGVAFESSSNRRATRLWKFNDTRKKVDASNNWPWNTRNRGNFTRPLWHLQLLFRENLRSLRKVERT